MTLLDFAGSIMPAFDVREAYDGLLPAQGDFAFVRAMGDGLDSLPPPVVDAETRAEAIRAVERFSERPYVPTLPRVYPIPPAPVPMPASPTKRTFRQTVRKVITALFG